MALGGTWLVLAHPWLAAGLVIVVLAILGTLVVALRRRLRAGCSALHARLGGQSGPADPSGRPGPAVTA